MVNFFLFRLCSASYSLEVMPQIWTIDKLCFCDIIFFLGIRSYPMAGNPISHYS
jgi:hypothetical protein